MPRIKLTKDQKADQKAWVKERLESALFSIKLGFHFPEAPRPVYDEDGYWTDESKEEQEQWISKNIELIYNSYIFGYLREVLEIIWVENIYMYDKSIAALSDKVSQMNDIIGEMEEREDNYYVEGEKEEDENKNS
jgi:hypothetical protein